MSKEKLQLIMTKGLPASGKSSWAKEQVANGDGKIIRVNKDDIRAMLHCGKWSEEREKMVLSVRDSIITEALHRGQSVIVDDTNFAPKHESTLRKFAEKYKAEFSIKLFDVDVDVCILRDAGRPNPVGEKVVRKMYHDYIQPNQPKQVIDPKLPYCIICDLDGTLADFKTSGHRGAYDIENCHNDDVVDHIEEIITTFRYEKGDTIIFLSGREEKARASTIEFFKNKCNPEHKWEKQKLFMRKDGDMRKDTVVKKELYQEHILGRYNVRFVLDDRTSVVKMWRRELGLVCLQVAEGDF